MTLVRTATICTLLLPPGGSLCFSGKPPEFHVDCVSFCAGEYHLQFATTAHHQRNCVFVFVVAREFVGANKRTDAMAKTHHTNKNAQMQHRLMVLKAQVIFSACHVYPHCLLAPGPHVPSYGPSPWFSFQAHTDVSASWFRGNRVPQHQL